MTQPSSIDSSQFQSGTVFVAVASAIGVPAKVVQLVREHVRIALAVKKPVVYHCRKAETDMLALLEEIRAWDAGGVMHCFSGSGNMAARCVEMGLYISFAGPVTFPDSKKLRAIAGEIPLDRILVETDAPYLAPVPFDQLGLRTDIGDTAFPAYTREFLYAVPLVLTLAPPFLLALSRASRAREVAEEEGEGGEA